MTFHIITLFPEAIEEYLHSSILGRAEKKKLIKFNLVNLRKFGLGKHKKVDEKPYGGGAGMVLMSGPILRAVDSIREKFKKKTKIIVFSAKGKQFNQKIAYNWSKKYDDIVLISGRYEGIDERVKNILKAEEISIGHYVLTDGDVAAMVVASAVGRLVPGAIKLESLEEESHWNLLLKKEKDIPEDDGLEYPHYTRPEVLVYKGKKYRVPGVLLSGHHGRIKEWRKQL
ncbi:MAG: tRNA (guanosine(37)-N1)-methyltransferase TrmD [Minisyncoccia bacterium]|jgi:tRNA (guanine37-N1)-methyltransferase